MEFNVVKVNRNTFDVFAGKQWGTWSRLRSGHSGVYVANGERLPHRVVKSLATAINPTQQTQLVQVNV